MSTRQNPPREGCLPPQNIEAEQRVLGALLLDVGMVAPVMEVLRPEHFYRMSHRVIYEAMLELFDHAEPIDILTLVDALKKMGKLDEAKGPEYVATLADDVSSAKRAVTYAKLVRNAAILRTLIHTSDAIAERAFSDEEDGDSVLLDARRAMEEIEPLAPATPATVCLADVEPEEVHWLLHPYIPLGKLTLLEGDPAVGKSWVALAIATSLSHGNGLPGQASFAPRSTLIFSAEDGLADTIRPRLDELGADVSRIHAWDDPITFDADGIARLEQGIPRLRPALVIIDPLVAYVGGGTDIHRANEVRSIMAPLAALAEKNSTAILAIRHLRKSESGRAIYRGAGSIDFTAAARSVLLAGKDPDDPSKRAFVHIKSNLALEGEPVGYAISEGRFAWTGPSDLTAERILAAEGGSEKQGARREAEDFLTEILTAGPVLASEVKQEARAAGISESTLRRAKLALGVKVRREGFGPGGSWHWFLPGNHRRSSNPMGAQEKSLSTNGKDEHLCGDGENPPVLEEVEL